MRDKYKLDQLKIQQEKKGKVSIFNFFPRTNSARSIRNLFFWTRHGPATFSQKWIIDSIEYYIHFSGVQKIFKIFLKFRVSSKKAHLNSFFYRRQRGLCHLITKKNSDFRRNIFLNEQQSKEFATLWKFLYLKNAKYFFDWKSSISIKISSPEKYLW